jgi:hypothetical protein
MPYGIRKINGPINGANLLSDLKACVTIAADSPTYLRWTDANRRQVTPGGIAGAVESNGRYMTVCARGWPIHVKHAVWMLANDAFIPEDQDVEFIDGNAMNPNPENLRLTPLKTFDPMKNLKVLTPEERERREKLMSMPHEVTITNGAWQGTFAVYVTVPKLNKKPIMFGQWTTPHEAIAATLRYIRQWEYWRADQQAKLAPLFDPDTPFPNEQFHVSDAFLLTNGTLAQSIYQPPKGDFPEDEAEVAKACLASAVRTLSELNKRMQGKAKEQS